MGEKQYAQEAEISGIRSLERQWDTNVEYGLTSTEAVRRQKKCQYHKKKKESRMVLWECLRAEMRDRIFLFSLFCTIFFLLVCENMVWSFGTALTESFFLFGKWKIACKNTIFLLGRKAMLCEKIQVLRDGIYKKIPAAELVEGDVLWLKKGERAPESLKIIGDTIRDFARGEIYRGNSSKAVATEISQNEKGKDGFRDFSAMELYRQRNLYENGVVIYPENRLADYGDIQVIILDEIFFPDERKWRRFVEFYENIKKQKKTLALFAGEDKAEFQKKMEKVPIYIHLTGTQKSEVIEHWKERAGTVFFLTGKQENSVWGLRFGGKNEEEITENCLRGKADFVFMRHWTQGIRKILEEEQSWNYCDKLLQKVQQATLKALCAVVFVMLFYEIFKDCPQNSILICGLTTAAVWILMLFRMILWNTIYRKIHIYE